jgi:hypothetical protein
MARHFVQLTVFLWSRSWTSTCEHSGRQLSAEIEVGPLTHVGWQFFAEPIAALINNSEPLEFFRRCLHTLAGSLCIRWGAFHFARTSWPTIKEREIDSDFGLKWTLEGIFKENRGNRISLYPTDLIW